MKIGIGIPNTVLNVPGRTMVEWARRAEARGFSSLATIGRIAYPGYDELVALAAAAGATERIGLFTNIMVVPAFDPVVLAKQTASLDLLSGGRFTLGVGVGGRPDDYAATGRDFAGRGRRLDSVLETVHRIWAGDPLEAGGKAAAARTTRGRVPLLFGGAPERAAPRAARWDGGFTIGGGGIDVARQAVPAFRAAFEAAGGEGEPRLVCLSYFSLGDEHAEESVRNLRSYYAWLTDWVESIAQYQPRTPDAIRDTVKQFEDLGIDEFIFDPSVADLDQVDRLADVVLE